MIDAGTSGLRSVAVTAQGDVSLLASRAWPIFTPDDTGPFGREFDARGTTASLHELLDEAGGQFAAVACTGQREGVVFMDAGGDAICISPNIDARASAEGIEIDAACAADVYRATGHLPSLMQVPAKLAWLRRHRPRDAERIRHALPLADWLTSRLTGACAMSRSLASENGLLDLTTGTLRAPPEVEADFLSSVVADGSVVGTVGREGPLAGTPVVASGGDSQCALLGLGAISDGECGVSAGWSAPLQLVTSAPVFDPEMRTWTGVHVAPDRFVLESNAGETGRAWAWACEIVGEAPQAAAAVAATAPTGSRDAIVVVGARAMRAASMKAGTGAMFVPLPLVMSAPSRADILRAVLESVAYAIRTNLEQLVEVSGDPIPVLRMGGGMARSRLFAQIVADAIDRPVEVASTPEVTSLGAAALAAPATGMYGSMREAIDGMCRREPFLPDANASAEYDDAYARWCALADGMSVIEGGA